MSGVAEAVVIVLSVAIFAIASGFWLIGLASLLAVHRPFDRYVKAAHPEVGQFRRTVLFNDSVWKPDELRREASKSHVGLLEDFFKWRQRLISACTGFFMVFLVVGGTVLLGFVARFFVYIYVKGQQAG